MKSMTGPGPGGRVVRAQKKLNKQVSKLPSVLDDAAQRAKKMANIDKTNAKVAKGVSRLNKAVEKGANKIVDKARDRMGKSSDLEKFMRSASSFGAAAAKGAGSAAKGVNSAAKGVGKVAAKAAASMMKKANKK